jgi:HK97 family phage major capsid protein
MAFNANEKLQQRGVLIKQMREMNDLVITEKRDFTSEEKEKYDKMEKESDAIKAQVDRHVAIEAAAKDNAHRDDAIRPNIENEDGKKNPRATKEYKQNYGQWMLYGARTPLDVTNSLTKATGTQAGYLVPTDYETEIRKKVYPLNVMRLLASVVQLDSDRVIPMEGSLPTFGWIDELGTYPQTDLTVGRATLSAYKLGGILKASEELLADSFTDIGAYIGDRSKVSIAQAEEAAFISGDGNKKPTGVVTSVTGGTTTASPTAPTADEVIDLIYALPTQYRVNATLLSSDGWVKLVRKLKDTTGQYLWQPSLQLGVPDRIYGVPYRVSNFILAPAATVVAALYGDFSYYQIVDRSGFEMQRLNELYAESGQIGFKINERVDGKLLNTDAIVKQTMHA